MRDSTKPLNVVSSGDQNDKFPKTVYRTANPEWGISESYEIQIEPVPGAPDQRKCWIVRELHGYYEEATKTFHHKVETLHPTDPQHFLTVDEAIRQADAQVLLRARQGFHFLFTLNYEKSSPPWYERFEVVLPEGQFRPF